MIPKIIHYCWFGGGKMPELVQRCIASWHQHMPEWEYRLWNETAISQTVKQSIPSQNEEERLLCQNTTQYNENGWLEAMPQYVREAYAAKKYAFVSDYVRLWALEREGGLYMDVDFEVYKSFNDLLQYNAFAGYEGSKYHPVMMGVIAAEAHHPWIYRMMATYENRHFLMPDGTLDLTPNTGYFLKWMQKQGFVADGVEKDWKNVHILPVECFCPVLTTGENLRCERTYCEHMGLHSWSGDGGWKTKVLNIFSPIWRIKLIKLKRKLMG